VKRGHHYALTTRTKYHQPESIPFQLADHDHPSDVVWGRRRTSTTADRSSLVRLKPLIARRFELNTRYSRIGTAPGNADERQCYRSCAAKDAIDPALLLHVGHVEGELEIDEVRVVELEPSKIIDFVLRRVSSNAASSKARLKMISEYPAVCSSTILSTHRNNPIDLRRIAWSRRFQERSLSFDGQGAMRPWSKVFRITFQSRTSTLSPHFEASPNRSERTDVARLFRRLEVRETTRLRSSFRTKKPYTKRCAVPGAQHRTSCGKLRTGIRQISTLLELHFRT